MPRSSADAAVAGTLVAARLAARRRLLARVMIAREDERRRLAHDLADRPLRAMAAIRTRLEELGARVEVSALSADVETLLLEVDEVCRSLRLLASDLLLEPEVEAPDGGR